MSVHVYLPGESNNACRKACKGTGLACLGAADGKPLPTNREQFSKVLLSALHGIILIEIDCIFLCGTNELIG